MLNWLKKKILKRSYAISDIYSITGDTPFFTNWNLQNTLQDGLKSSVWIYRSIFLISKSAASVPWYVKKDNVILPEHHLTQLFRKPNPYISRQDIIELITSWLELTGNSYLYKNKIKNKTQGIFPVSPDRLKPIISKNPLEWVKGYALDTQNRISFQTEEIIHHIIFPDPINPFYGLSPLEIAGKVVDIDKSMLDFNFTTAKSKGVVDGVFTFDRTFETIEETSEISNAIEEKIKSRRGFVVLGNNGKYQRLGLNPAEMDYSESRKSNRDEILAAFGVPPQLVGAMESSTYNNFQTSELIFWACTMLPLLDDLLDTFNHSFSDELAENEILAYDITKIPAMQRALKNRTDMSEQLSKMGVPFEQINRLFDLGIEEYYGWDRPVINQYPQTEIKSRKAKHEVRSAEAEAESRDKYAEKKVLPVFFNLLSKQQDLIINNLKDSDLTDKIKQSTLGWHDVWFENYIKTGLYFSKNTEFRDFGGELADILTEYLESEQTVLSELGMISDTTADAITDIVSQGITEGWAVAQMQQAIYDLGVFAPSRALSLARTITGTAASLGQYKTAEKTGAERKQWQNSGSHVRDSHIRINGEKRKLNERYSNGGMYPLDPALSPAERVNCRCSQLFF